MIPILVRKVNGRWHIVCPERGAVPCASWAAAIREAYACATVHGIRLV